MTGSFFLYLSSSLMIVEVLLLEFPVSLSFFSCALRPPERTHADVTGSK